MYLGMTLGLFGVAVLLGSLVAFFAPVALVITVEVLFIPHEECALEETFGREYVAYKDRVRRWL